MSMTVDDVAAMPRPWHEQAVAVWADERLRSLGHDPAVFWAELAAGDELRGAQDAQERPTAPGLGGCMGRHLRSV